MDEVSTGERPAGRPPWWRVPRSGSRPFPVTAFDGSVVDLVRAVASEGPDRIALRAPAGERTYRELLDDVARIASAVDELAPAGNVPVALVLAHDGPLVAALLGVLAAGKVVHVLDPQGPGPVSRALLEDSGARLLLTDEANRSTADEVAPPGTDVRLLAEVAGSRQPTFPDVHVGPEHGAMLAYTSGTTGSPKGALISHGVLLQLGRGAVDGLAIGPEDRLPMLFPLSLAVAAYPLFLPLFTGGTLCVLDVRSVGLDPLPAWVEEQAITVMYLSPTVIRFIQDLAPPGDYTSVRLVVLGGERVDLGAVEVARQLFGEGVLLANGYGLTETGVLTFWFLDEQAPPSEGATVPVGHPIADTELLVRDEEGAPVPAGTTGEVFVRSPHLFSGYWGRPELDAAVLQDDPLTGVPVYATGDLGRVDAEGWLELVGRSDAQVKIRGHRVVIGEVEEALLGLPLVKDAVVVHRRDGDKSTLVAFLVPSTVEEEAAGAAAAEASAADTSDVDTSATGRPSVSGVRSALADVVAAPMVPATFVLLDELPALPNGKLDRQALRVPVGERPELGTVYKPPADDVEKRVLALWEALLDVAPMGVADDFFELGGHSLLAASMLIQVEEAFGVAVPMGELIEGVTVERVADIVRRGEPARGRSTLVQVQAGAPDRPPLFWGHDLHGSAFRFQALGRALGEDQPLYSFESPFLAAEPPPFRSLETLALAYASDLTRAFPEGPYHLGGYSFGGVLAFEIARHLVRDGHQVALLAIVDVGPGYRGEHFSLTTPPAKPWLGIAGPPDPALSVRQKVEYYRGMSARGAARHVVWRAGLDRYLEPYLFRKDLRETGRIAPGHRLWYAWRRHWELGAKHWDWDGASYAGRVELLWSEESGSTDATMGWGDIAEGGVGVHRVPGPHEEMMEEGAVGATAAVLRRLIDEVDQP
jgi:amino acid adenylation domain-containing protein